MNELLRYWRIDGTHFQMDSKVVDVLKGLHGALHQSCTPEVNVVSTCKFSRPTPPDIHWA